MGRPPCSQCRRVERLTSLCAEAVCFLRVSELGRTTIPALDPVAFPDTKDFRESFHDGSITFFLVRWFEAHPVSHERDHLHRPICPGPLHINHCLWTYAKTTNARQSVPHTWGLHQRYAYYGLIFPQNIIDKVNITPCFLSGSTDTGNDWLESVTLI